MLTQRSPLIAGSELGVVLTPSRRTLNPVGALRGGWADWDNYVLSAEPAGGNSRSYEGNEAGGPVRGVVWSGRGGLGRRDRTALGLIPRLVFGIVLRNTAGGRKSLDLGADHARHPGFDLVTKTMLASPVRPVGFNLPVGTVDNSPFRMLLPNVLELSVQR